MLKAGFSIDTPIRQIYLLKNRIEREERYLEIHRFLAELNKKLADALLGADHIWYIREYLYHSAFIAQPQQMIQILEQAVQQIIKESPILFEQFYEEFSQDKELRDQLSEEQVLTVLSLLYQYRAQMNLRLARQVIGNERLNYLQEFFSYTIRDPQTIDHYSTLKKILKDLITEDKQVFTLQVFTELANDERFKAALGQQSELFASLVQEIVTEGW